MNDVERYEILAETACEAMYDVSSSGAAKMHYEDARLYLSRAMEAAGKLGLVEEATRLEQRRDHIREVFNNQIRGV